ncbi:MAG: substrate-binding domain-containing protein [Planctomycetia bacterium]|nr:substrate-binding domain-containing protein [Planctomycetia bacterium]
MGKEMEPRRVAIVVELFNKFGSDIFAGIGQYVYEHPHWQTRHHDFVMETSPPKWLKTWNGDGIIVRDRTGKACNAALLTQAKVVDLSILRHPQVPTVLTDQFQAVELAVKHLRERFFQNLAFVTIAGVPFCDARKDAFQQIAGKHCPIFTFPVNPLSKSFSANSDTESLGNWLESLPKATGIVACYDPVGLKVLETCAQRKIPVPASLAVVGINNDEVYCQLANPPMSSVAQNGYLTGYLACALLESLMNGNPPPSPPSVRSHGVAVRRSTDTWAIEDPLLLQAVRFIHRNISSGIDVSDVAKHVGCCRRTLERRFQKTLHSSVLEEIQKTRLQTVCQLLCETELTVETIALKAGFQNSTHLHHLFRDRMNVTPNQYRRKFRL